MRRRDRRTEDRAQDAVRATTEELCSLIEPFRDEQRRMAELLELLHDELCEPDNQ